MSKKHWNKRLNELQNELERIFSLLDIGISDRFFVIPIKDLKKEIKKRFNEAGE